MASLKYFDYPGMAERKMPYSQAVRMPTTGERIELSGQCGVDPHTKEIPEDKAAQVDLAFKNVDAALKAAGGKGWSEVYRVNTYHVDWQEGDGALAAVIRNFKEWIPDHKPLWTCVGVTRLGDLKLTVEIEVVAYVADSK